MTTTQMKVSYFHSLGLSDVEIAMSLNTSRESARSMRYILKLKRNSWDRKQKCCRAYCKSCGHIRPHVSKYEFISGYWECQNCGNEKTVL